MANTKVLVVDDSLTMRALISNVLDGLPGIEVVGTADSAAEARLEVERLNPNVMTLDVEMPGMSGIEYLAELMERRPMPVIMFSTRTEAGASSSIEALRLGAIDCFPKPRAATQGEFNAILGKLGKRIKSAKMSSAKPSKVVSARKDAFAWNGRLLLIGTDASGTQKLFDLLGALPKNCPPTVIVQHLNPDLSDSLIQQLDAHAAPRVVKAEDLAQLEQGTVYITRPGQAHVAVDRWPDGGLRQLPRDPVAGERPSISVLFAAAAKAAGDQAVAIMLTEAGEDGVVGLKTILNAGGHVITPPSLLGDTASPADYVLAKGTATDALAWETLANTAVDLCRK